MYGQSFLSHHKRTDGSRTSQKGLAAFRNPSKWPDWNSSAKSMLATKPEAIDEGDHLAIFQVVKGSLIETKWLVKSIHEGEDFCEIELLGEGQSRNERPIAKGLENLQISITFLYQEDGGIEVHASCEVSIILSMFSKQINAFMKKQAEQFISDLSSIE